MLPKLDTFVLLTNEGPSKDKKDAHWSMIKHGDDGAATCRLRCYFPEEERMMQHSRDKYFP